MESQKVTKKKNKSKRNRHTGRINAFKAKIIENGQTYKFASGPTLYRGMRVGDGPRKGLTMVRVS